MADADPQRTITALDADIERVLAAPAGQYFRTMPESIAAAAVAEEIDRILATPASQVNYFAARHPNPEVNRRWLRDHIDKEKIVGRFLSRKRDERDERLCARLEQLACEHAPVRTALNAYRQGEQAARDLGDEGGEPSALSIAEAHGRWNILEQALEVVAPGDAHKIMVAEEFRIHHRPDGKFPDAEARSL